MRWLSWVSSQSKQVDERIVNTQNKIYKEIYMLIMLICLGSVIVKYAVLDMDRLLITEIVIMLASSLYYLIRSVSLGVYSDAVEVHDRSSKFKMSTKNIVAGSIFGLGLALFFGFRSATLYADGAMQSLWYFILVFAVSLMIYVPVFLLLTFGLHMAANKASTNVTKDELE
ncbi:DUF6773 family protein [Paenibacillus bouchesdurhonensis]|uniref:DUF6773 family protein n=1 Tax=Paenibacillus bouchesdurhonensis TaxID=1870990 RepID=UPI000DA61EFC|nr:DUF6773 family protein [Paenibacillus bouchesdurhonensis]